MINTFNFLYENIVKPTFDSDEIREACCFWLSKFDQVELEMKEDEFVSYSGKYFNSYLCFNYYGGKGAKETKKLCLIITMEGEEEDDEVEDYFTNKETMLKIVKLGKEEECKDSSFGENEAEYDSPQRRYYYSE